MARKLRLQFKGAIYHITVRGNGRRRIFCDERDRERLMWRLGESVALYDVRLYLLCLMENHFHLLVETPRANISRFMQSVLTGYSVYFNLRHRTSGHVVQGRYGAQLVDGNEYLLRLSRYIHLNPVHVRKQQGLSTNEKVMYLRAYRWSTYRGYIDKRRRFECVEYGPVLGLMEGPKEARDRGYRSFVEAGLAQSEDEFAELMKGNPRAVGDIGFRRWVDAEYKKLREAAGSKEDVSFRREAELTDVASILDNVAGEYGIRAEDLRCRLYGSLARPVAARMLCKHAGMSQREAGRVLGYGTGASVSTQLRRLRSEMDTDSGLARQVTRIEKRLAALQ
ncbi:transposase [Verrucomicrobiota bacterium]